MNEIVGLIQKGNVVAFCGAGLSCESEIPPFRGEGGLWEKYDPQTYVSIQGIEYLLKHDPAALRDFLLEVLTGIVAAQPNEAHCLLARLEEEGILLGTITQNIDGLHFYAGTRNLACLHGDIYRFFCPRCLKEVILSREQLNDSLLRLAQAFLRFEIVHSMEELIGSCPECGSRLRSTVVLFGQMLPDDQLDKAQKYIEKAQTLLCIGTSATVYPAASLPYFAREKGVRIVTVNPKRTLLDEISQHILPLSAVEFARKYLSLTAA